MKTLKSKKILENIVIFSFLNIGKYNSFVSS